MKIVAIGLTTLLVLSSTAAFARGGSSNRQPSCNLSAAPCGVTSPPGVSNNLAGSAPAGANSIYNPSGNSYINTSPSGSTVGEGSGVGGGASVGGGHR
jgi:hypothetical protein